MKIENGILYDIDNSDIAGGTFEVPIGVTIIRAFTFNWSLNITSVIIPESVANIEDFAFVGCLSLINITVDPNNKNYSSVDGVLFDKNQTKLIQYPVGNTRTSYTIPDSVASIGVCSFDCCVYLKSITIPDSITTINSSAFDDCIHLKTKPANYKVFSIIGGKLICCQDYEYTPNKWSNKLDNIEICKKGYHYCTNLFELFNYYYGELDKDIAIYECKVGNKVIKGEDSSHCCTNRIKPVKRLYREDVIRILNGG